MYTPRTQELGYVLLDRFLSANIFADSRLVESIDLSPAGNVLATGSDDQARICTCLLICRMILDVLIVFQGAIIQCNSILDLSC